MKEARFKNKKYCRWCGRVYFASQPTDRDGFCCDKHKQARHRAWVKYVTATDGPRGAGKNR